MNSIQQNTDFSSERQECNNIYQVLGHSAIFNPLLSCVFSNLQEIPNKREEREYFLQQPENIGQILDFFKDQEKWCLFEDELLDFYETHKEALKPTEAQKNIVWIAIWAMKKYISHLSNKIKPNLSITDTTDNVKWIQEAFKNLVSKQLPDKEILSDIGWNIINDCEKWRITSLFNKEVAKIQWRYIDVETRVPIVIQWRYTIANIIGDNNSFKKVQLYDMVKNKYIERYLKEDFTILTDDEWIDISNIWLQRDFFWKKVKHIKVAKQIAKNWIEYVEKLTDSDFNTLRDEKWREIIRFYQWNGSAYLVFILDDDARKIKTFYDKEWKEIKWFFKTLWWRLLDML